jgi:hypothetical protein
MSASSNLHESEARETIDREELITRVVVPQSQVSIHVVSGCVDPPVLSQYKGVLTSSSHLLSREAEVTKLLETHHDVHIGVAELPIGVIPSYIDCSHVVEGKGVSLAA